MSHLLAQEISRSIWREINWVFSLIIYISEKTCLLPTINRLNEKKNLLEIIRRKKKTNKTFS